MRFDSGGFGKGQALEDAAAALARLHPGDSIRSLQMDFGGQIFWWRPARDGAGARLRDEWLPDSVAVANPRRRDQPVLEISLRGYGLQQIGESGHGLSVATSAGNVRGDHIVDPTTGELVSKPALSVTVIAGSPFWADCLSTGLYVLYSRDAQQAVDAAEAQRVDIVAVEAVNDRVSVTVTAGLEDRVSAVAEIHLDIRRGAGVHRLN